MMNSTRSTSLLPLLFELLQDSIELAVKSKPKDTCLQRLNKVTAFVSETRFLEEPILDKECKNRDKNDH